MKLHTPRIDPILRRFFDRELRGKDAPARVRIEAMESRLRQYLESSADRILTDGELMLVQAEREFDPVGAFARCLDEEVLLFSLPGFVEGDRLADDMRERITQLEVTAHLLQFLLARPFAQEADYSCIAHSIRHVLELARDAMRASVQG